MQRKKPPTPQDDPKRAKKNWLTIIALKHPDPEFVRSFRTRLEAAAKDALTDSVQQWVREQLELALTQSEQERRERAREWLREQQAKKGKR